MTTMAVMPADGSVPAGDGGCCKRAGCGRPLPPGERGRSRQFCSDQCRIRHYNAQRGQPAVAPLPPADGPQAALGKLSQLLAEASRLAAAASAQIAAADPGRVAAVLAEAEAARRRIGAGRRVRRVRSLSNLLCELGQLSSFCYITVGSFRCSGQTGTRSPNATENAFMAAFQP